MALTYSPKQIESIAQSTGRVNVWEGGIRSGKTFASILVFCNAVNQHQGPGVIVITGKNKDSIFRNFFEPVFTIPELTWLANTIHYRQGASNAKILGKTVHVIGANDNQAETKLRGVTVALAYADEVTVLPENFFKQLLGRMSAPGAQMFATTNPDSPHHWFKTQYLDRLDVLADWRRFTFTLDDNPSLSEAYKNSIKAEYTGLWYKRFIEGKWVAAEGAIYDMWDPTQHVTPHDALPRVREVLATGIDYGTTNPTSAITLAILHTGQLCLLDEWRLDHTNRGHATWTDSQQSEAIRTHLNTPHHPSNPKPPRWVFLDPAAASLRQQLYVDGQTNLYNANNHVEEGIKLIATGLTEGWLTVSDRCQGFISEAPGYTWDPEATLDGHDKPIKRDDHSLDAARYALASTQNTWLKHVQKYQRRHSS